MLPDVKILLQNGSLGGLVQFAEGVAGIIGTGTAVSGGIAIGDPRLFTKLQDAIDAGITSSNNPEAYRQLKEFYDESGDGAQLYFMLVPDTMNQTQMMDKTNANGLMKLLAYAQGKIRMVVSYFVPASGYSLVTTNGIDSDVFTAITNAQALCIAQAANQTPVRVILEGRAFTGVAANLTDLTTLTDNRVSVMIGGTLNDGSCSVGLLLGRFAKNPVQRKPSRVRDGALTIAGEAYIGTATVESYSDTTVLHDKHYITMRTFATKTGYYFTGDPTAAPDTDDYSMFCRGRVIDKAAVIAYGVYVDEVDGEVPINPDGTLDVGYISHLQAEIDNQINDGMTANGNISGVASYINPAQNVVSTSQLNVTLKLRPVGYSSDIEVALGFEVSTNS